MLDCYEEISVGPTRCPILSRGTFASLKEWLRGRDLNPKSRREVFSVRSKGPLREPVRVLYMGFCCSNFATSAVHPVWWLAPRPAPVSPLKYS